MNNKKMMEIADKAGVIRSHEYHELKNKLAFQRLETADALDKLTKRLAMRAIRRAGK